MYVAVPMWKGVRTHGHGRRVAAAVAVSLLWLGVAQDAPSSASPFALVSRQLVAEECPGMDASGVEAWSMLQTHFFEAHSMYYAPDAQGRWLALDALLRGLAALLGDLRVAYQCPMSCARHFRLAGEWALALGHLRRARGLVQMGNIFRIQAMARWWNMVGSVAEPGVARRYEPRTQVEYTVAVTQLHSALQVPLRPLASAAGPGRGKLRIDIHSICNYREDPTSNTGSTCPLPQLSVPNHKAYAAQHGYRYVLHTELLLPDREAHYSKMLVVHEALRAPDAPDWVFFIDCDAFFTNASVALEDILDTYGATDTSGPHFVVAEDPGGINTGTLLFRRSDWSLAFLERVAQSQFGVAWDQSMFFWEILRPNLLALTPGPDGLPPGDAALPPEVAFAHQAHLNAFVQPAARDWSAYEWQPGDFVRHFAGCPWQEQHCLGLMEQTAALAA